MTQSDRHDDRKVFKKGRMSNLTRFLVSERTNIKGKPSRSRVDLECVLCQVFFVLDRGMTCRYSSGPLGSGVINEILRAAAW